MNPIRNDFSDFRVSRHTYADSSSARDAFKVSRVVPFSRKVDAMMSAPINTRSLFPSAGHLRLFTE